MSLQFKTARKTESKSFLDDLEDAVSRGTPESRARALWHTTDLMIAGGFSDDEIWTFGEEGPANIIPLHELRTLKIKAGKMSATPTARSQRGFVNLLRNLITPELCASGFVNASARAPRSNASSVSPVLRPGTTIV